MNLYYLCGLGTDERLFRPLMAEGLPGRVLPYPEPLPGDTPASYAGRWALHLPQADDAVFVGMSFGGILACELARLAQPRALVLLSTVKQSREVPPYLRALRALAHRLSGAQLRALHLQAARLYYGRSPSAEGRLIQDMIAASSDAFYRFAIQGVLGWHQPLPPPRMLHLHGTADRVFPIRYVRQATAIAGGTHLMVLQRPRELARHIRRYLHGLD